MKELFGHHGSLRPFYGKQNKIVSAIDHHVMDNRNRCRGCVSRLVIFKEESVLLRIYIYSSILCKNSSWCQIFLVICFLSHQAKLMIEEDMKNMNITMFHIVVSKYHCSVSLFSSSVIITLYNPFVPTSDSATEKNDKSVPRTVSSGVAL